MSQTVYEKSVEIIEPLKIRNSFLDESLCSAVISDCNETMEFEKENKAKLNRKNLKNKFKTLWNKNSIKEYKSTSELSDDDTDPNFPRLGLKSQLLFDHICMPAQNEFIPVPQEESSTLRDPKSVSKNELESTQQLLGRLSAINPDLTVQELNDLLREKILPYLLYPTSLFPVLNMEKNCIEYLELDEYMNFIAKPKKPKRKCCLSCCMSPDPIKEEQVVVEASNKSSNELSEAKFLRTEVHQQPYDFSSVTQNELHDEADCFEIPSENVIALSTYKLNHRNPSIELPKLPTLESVKIETKPSRHSIFSCCCVNPEPEEVSFAEEDNSILGIVTSS